MGGYNFSTLSATELIFTITHFIFFIYFVYFLFFSRHIDNWAIRHLKPLVLGWLAFIPRYFLYDFNWEDAWRRRILKHIFRNYLI